MWDEKQFMNSWMGMARTSFETGKRSLDSFAEQTEKAMDLALKNADILRDETRKMYNTWAENNKNLRQMYQKAFEDGLNTIEQQFTTKGKSPGGK
ncbi:MAG: hypothetical protein QNJ97_06365 [Myxococcota bacterium]|nr:hypothetical protein [Myxococcota bacterium]